MTTMFGLSAPRTSATASIVVHRAVTILRLRVHRATRLRVESSGFVTESPLWLIDQASSRTRNVQEVYASSRAHKPSNGIHADILEERPKRSSSAAVRAGGAGYETNWTAE